MMVMPRTWVASAVGLLRSRIQSQIRRRRSSLGLFGVLLTSKVLMLSATLAGAAALRMARGSGMVVAVEMTKGSGWLTVVESLASVMSVALRVSRVAGSPGTMPGMTLPAASV